MKVQYCFIRREYFEEHSNFINMLDPGNADKQSKTVWKKNHCFEIQV